MSKWVNTGMQRATELVLDKRVGGNSIAGYPKVYRLCDGFQSMPSVDKEKIAQMSQESYLARLGAFKIFVESIETGLTVNTSDAYRENLTTCPII